VEQLQQMEQQRDRGTQAGRKEASSVSTDSPVAVTLASLAVTAPPPTASLALQTALGEGFDGYLEHDNEVVCLHPDKLHQLVLHAAYQPTLWEMQEYKLHHRVSSGLQSFFSDGKPIPQIIVGQTHQQV
jgi:hypothetical protein